MTAEDIKRLQMAHQHLLVPAERRVAIRDLCGYQAQYHRNAVHSARLRSMPGAPGSDWAEGCLKTWTLRGTLHVFDEADLPLFVRRRLEPEAIEESSYYAFMCKMGFDVPPERMRLFARIVVDAVAGGEGSRDGLKAICRDAGMTDKEGEHLFSGWGGLIRELSEIGQICMRASERRAYRITPEFIPMGPQDAKREMVRRYYTHMGPATLRDCAYYLQIRQRELRGIVDSLACESFEHEGSVFYSIPGGAEPAAEIPPVVFLSGFDALMLGYDKKESLYLAKEDLRGIFNMTGIVFPALLVEGKVAGRWKPEKKRIEITAFRPLRALQKKRVLREAERLWPDAEAAFVDL